VSTTMACTMAGTHSHKMVRHTGTVASASSQMLLQQVAGAMTVSCVANLS
jgi:hypothetical protein